LQKKDIKKQRKARCQDAGKAGDHFGREAGEGSQEVDCEISGDKLWSIRIEYDQELRALKQQQVLTIVDEEDEEDEVD
jgi:hypothetical protein